MCALNQLSPEVYLFFCSRWVLSNWFSNLDIILNLVIHIVLIYDDFNYSQLIYDRMVRPFYKNNEGKINNKTKILEEYFEEKAQQVQFKVTKSARESTWFSI